MSRADLQNVIGSEGLRFSGVVYWFCFSLALLSGPLVLEYFMLSPMAVYGPAVDEYRLMIDNNAPIQELLLAKVQLYYLVLQSHWLVLFIPISFMSMAFVLRAYMERRLLFTRVAERLSSLKSLHQQERTRRKSVLLELDKSREHLYNVHEQLSEGFLVVTKDVRIDHLNRVAVQSLSEWTKSPKSVRHYVGHPLETYFPNFVSSGLSGYVREVLSKGILWQKDIFLEAAKVWLHVRIYPAEKGTAYIYFQDITDQKKPSGIQKVSENLLQKICQTVPFAMAVVDREWKYQMVSDFWREKFQLDGDVIGQSHRMYLPQFPGNWQALEKQLFAGKSVKNSETMYHFNGKEEWLSWEIRPWLVGEKVRGFIMYAAIQTESHQDKQRLTQQREREQQLAYHDILTGLPNRQLFYDRLSMALAQAYRQVGNVGLFFLDLDGFKGINDNLGHDVGDLLLKEVAERLKHCVRETDTVARLGGDEFTIILSGLAQEEDATQVAKKVIKEINKPYHLAGNEINVSTSIGISLYPKDGSSVNDIIKKADNAMYTSKESGKNCYTYFSAPSTGEVAVAPRKDKPALDKDSISQRDLETHIRVALQKGELELDFQPQYEAKSGKVFGMEALLRWNHPVLGRLLPSEFLNMAETTGSILTIGEWVLEQSCEKAKEWSAKYKKPLLVAVNISKRQLLDESLLKRMQRVLDKTGVDIGMIAFEISEALLVDDTEGLKEAICALKSTGCKLVVDDFGSGYTPMMQLKDVPLDMIKIHRTFVHQADEAEGKAVIRSMLTLGESLKLAVIAEGVEDKVQVKSLMALGCTHMQGFYFGEPKSEAKEIAAFFAKGVVSGKAFVENAQK